MFPGIAKDMGVTEGQLAGEVADDVIDIKPALFLGQLCVEDHLEKEIPQLFFHIGDILFPDGRLKLMGFFKKVLQKRGMGLLSVPGAPLGRPELGHDLHELVE